VLKLRCIALCVVSYSVREPLKINVKNKFDFVVYHHLYYSHVKQQNKGFEMKTLKATETKSLVKGTHVFFVYYVTDRGTTKRFFYSSDVAELFYDSCK